MKNFSSFFATSLPGSSAFLVRSLYITILLFLVTVFINHCAGQVILLDEDFGTTSSFPTGWTPSNTDWQNDNAVVSSGYTGASGRYNAQYINNTTNTRTLTYSNNLSTIGYTNISLLWGARYTGSSSITIVVSWSANGSTWNNVSFTNVSKDGSWDLVNNGTRIVLPSGAAGISNLRLRISASSPSGSSNTSYRVDDFSVAGCPSSPGTITYAGSPYCKSISSAQAVTLTGTTGGTYTSTTGLTINAGSGAITPGTSTVGTYTVTYTVAATSSCPAQTTTASVTIAATPTVAGTSTQTCVDGSTGTITATASGGSAPYTYRLNSGSYQSSASFTGLAAGTYTLTVQTAAGCTASTSVTVSRYANSTDNQNAAGTDNWIGHMYNGTAFTDYIGQFSEAESFNELFGGSTVCFNVVSNAATSSIYTESFSVKYRMNSTKNGLYVANLGADDGNRLTVDGTLVYNYWSDNSYVTKPSVLFNLNGASSLLYEYYENSGANQVAFQSLTLVLANTISTNTAQSICLGSTGSVISGDTYGTLPSGISLSGTGYQWSYSTTAGGARTAIAGATGATFTPSATAAPFTTAGTYYVYREATLSSVNNISPNPYVATNISNVATITVGAAPSATIAYAGSPFCTSSATASVTLSGTTGGTFSAPTGLSINATTGAVNPAASTPGTYTVTYTVAATAGCSVYTTTATITITAAPSGSGSYAGSPYCSNGGTAFPSGNAPAGGTFASTTGLSLNSSTGAINLAASTPGTYTVTYTIPASGGCAAFTFSTAVTITAAPSATITYAGSPYCSNAGTAAVTQTGTSGGMFSSTAGLSLDSTTGNVNPGLSTAGTYTVTYTIAAAGGCGAVTTTAPITILAAPAISLIPVTGLAAYYKFEGNANDATGKNNGTLQNSPAATADRFNISGKAYSFNGSTQYISSVRSYLNPADLTLSIWFKTTTTTGGKLIGLGNAITGASSSYDRHIYMNNAGQIYFGTYSGIVNTLNSTLSYNDGNWHLATATLSGTTGTALYIDGEKVSADAVVRTTQNYSGFIRIGYDNMNGWTGQPSSSYFNGSLDDALVYQSVLSPAEIATLYRSPDGAGNNGPVCIGSSLNLTAVSVTGATYLWTRPNDFVTSIQNPTLVYTAANAGVYTLHVTAAGCTSTAYTNVISSTNAGQWTGYASTDWANTSNWCDGVVPTSSTNVVIPAGVTRMPSIGSSVSCNDLTIHAGASVTITAAGTLNIAGTLTNNGTYTDNGTTNFNGTSGQQTFAGVTTFNNLTVANASGLLLPVTIVVKNTLTVVAGILNAGSFSISVAGNWINNASASAFTTGTGTVTFNGATAQSIGGSFATTFNNLTVSNASGTISLGVNAAITGNLTVSAGTFDLGGFTANRTTAGGFLTVSNGAKLKIGGTGTFPVNYTSVTLVVASTVEYAGTNQPVSNQLYGNLLLSSSSGAAVKTFPATAVFIAGNLGSTVGSGTSVTFTAASGITVGGNVSIGASTTFNGGNYAHSIGSNWVNNGTFNGNTGTIIFTGSGANVSGAGLQNFNNLTIAGSGITFSAMSIALTGNLATTGSGGFIQASGVTLVMAGSGTTISGTGISIDNLMVSGSVSTTSSLTFTGNLSVSGSFTSSTGTIIMSGNTKTISGSGSTSFSTLNITGSVAVASNFTISSALIVDGSLSASAGVVTFTGTSTLSGTANLFSIVLNGTSLKLSTGSVLCIANTLTITSGALDVTTSAPNTINYNGSGVQNINGITYSNLIVSNGNTKTAVGAIIILNDITIGSGTTFDPAAYTHKIYGNWINSGTFTAGTSTVQFVGPANSFITGATAFNILTSNTTNASTSLILQNNVSAAVVNMINGIIQTGTNTLSITNTRTGNGFIYGNIQRTHAFTTGVAYAFEGPNNTITFSAVSAVTSITVSVNKGSISDFPFGGSISRQYTISMPSGTYNATLRLHYEDDELNGNNESSMALWHYNGSSWATIGKTANNTTSNYVEQAGLTDISNRWTLSDNANLVQWNGSVSGDWNTAANWTVLQGAASGPPSSSDIVDLGTASFVNQPVISSSVTVKNIVFGSAQAISLTLAPGGTLTTLGDITGTWSANAIHTINVNNQSLTVTGNMELSDGVNGHAINLNIGPGTVAILNSLSQTGNANVTFSGAGTLHIYGDFNYSSGMFAAGTGTVNYSGVENQVVAHVNYNNLTINKTAGIATINDTVNIIGNLHVMLGELDNFSTTTIAGNVTIDSLGTFSNSLLLHAQGNWNNQGRYTANGASTYFDGSGNQAISSTTFNNLVINKPSGTATITGEVIVTGDFNIASGTFDFQSYSVTRSVVGGTTFIANGATGIIGGNNGPANFATKTIGLNSTLIYNGVSTQYVSLDGVSLGNVIFRNGGSNPKLLVTPGSIKGNLTIENGATLNGSAFTLTLEGNWVNNGTFTPSVGTVIFAGAGKTLTGNSSFYRSSITGSYTVFSDLTFDKLLEITSTGSIISNTGIATIVNGDLSNNGVLITTGSATFTGNVLQTISLINATTLVNTVYFTGSVSPVLNSTSAVQFNKVNINNTAGINPTVGWTILDSLTIGSGASFNLGTSTHNVLGAVTNNGRVTSNGTLNFIPASAATISLGTGFSSMGTVVFGGAGAITLTGTPVSMRTVVISNTHPAGITPSSAWNMTNNFRVNSGSVFNAGNFVHTVGGNIVNNGVINSGTSTFILNGAGLQDIFSQSAFNNLTVSKTAGTVSLSSDVAVNSIMNFVSGQIFTNGHILVQPSSGTVTGASRSTGWVNGKLQKTIATGATAKTFEIGDGTNYTPLTVQFSSVTASGNLTAFTTAGDHPDAGNSGINVSHSVNRYWTLINSGITCTDYAATLNFVPADVDAGATTSSFKVGLNNGVSWTLPASDLPRDTSIHASGMTAFGDFVIGEVCNSGTSVSYPSSPYCSNGDTALVTLTGNPGGTFASTAGLAIDAVTGTVNLSSTTPGSYVVTYTLNATAGCRVYSTPAAITISAAPSATLSYTGSPYCLNAGTASVALSGTTGGIFSSTAGLSIDSLTGSINLAASAAGTYTVTYTIAAASGCGRYATTTAVSIILAGTWTGAVSNNWYTAANWLCGAIPVSTTNVTIPGGLTRYPAIGSGTGYLNNITIQTGAMLSVTGATLQIGGAISNNGMINAGSGTIEMKGSAAQLIPAGTFSGNTVMSLVINNGAGVTLGGAVNITDVLTILNGSLASEGYLTLKSTATTTARVARITSAAATPVSGNVTVERYIAGRRKYRLMTSTVTTAPVSVLTAGQESLSIWGSWQNGGNNISSNTGTIITGGSSADGFDQQTTNPSLFTYDEVNKTYMAYTSANGRNTMLTPLKAGVAYYMFIYGDRINTIYTPSPNNTILRSTGTLLTGDQVYNTGSAIPLSGVTGRFTLLGNPFASSVNWATIPKTNLENTYWGWDPNLSNTGGYVTVTTLGSVTVQAPFSGVTGLNQYIQPGQGFFVRTSGASPVLTIREADKTADFNGSAFRVNAAASNELPLIAVNLFYQNGSNHVLADGVVAAFDNAFSSGQGPEDATKMLNSTESIAISNGTALLSIDARKMPEISDTLLLNLSRLTLPRYTLQIFTKHLDGTGLQAYLQDSYLNTLQPLLLTDTNNVTFYINTGIPASFGPSRFRIVFNSSNVSLPVTYTAVRGIQKDKWIQINWDVAEEKGIRKYEIEKWDGVIDFYKVGEVAALGNTRSEWYQWIDRNPVTGNNFYRIRALQEDNKSFLSKTVLVSMRSSKWRVKIFPNPVVNKQINILSDYMEKGRYAVQVHNTLGQQIAYLEIDHPGGKLNQVVYIKKMLPSGMYYLEIGNGKETSRHPVFIE